jgi:signal transduction histidine kinase
MENIKTRVLFIEDDKVDQMAFKRVVKAEKLSYDYTIAGSVSEAKQIIDSESFDIVITDYLLGGGTAFDIFDSIIDTPIIFVTGAGDEELAVKALKAGASDYLVKDPERNYLKFLPVTIENAIKHKKVERALKHAEEVLRESEKMAALGRFVAGAAHEINNPLAIIAGNAQYLIEWLRNKRGEVFSDADIDELINSLDLIQKNCMRGGNITTQLLVFSRQGKQPVKLPMDLNTSLQAVLTLMRHQMELSNIKIEIQVDSLPLVLANHEQMEQVFMNILTNSWHAMRNGGQLNIHNFKTEDNQIAVQIRDTGVGIAPEILDRIFEPFFTTKAPGEGTGLGLSGSYSILKEHNGEIKIESQLGQGTTVTVFLPMATE